ncbi:hypothetical protein GCM10027398_09970 [Azotobacter salinestris]
MVEEAVATALGGVIHGKGSGYVWSGEKIYRAACRAWVPRGTWPGGAGRIHRKAGMEAGFVWELMPGC